MDLQGGQIIRSERRVVAAALTSPEILARCLDGCESLKRTEEHVFEGIFSIKVGPIRPTFQTVVSFTDVFVGERYTIVGEGKGGAVGFAKGSIRLSLADVEDCPGSTRLSYGAEWRVGGKLAQVGARLIQSTAQAYVGLFFDRLRDELEGRSLPFAGCSPVDAGTTPATSDGMSTTGRRIWFWLAAAALLSALTVWAFR